jgi:hypothetical protein
MTGFFSSLRVRLLVIVFFAALPAIGVIIYSSLEQRQFAKENASREIFNNVLTIASFQKRMFDEAHKELGILSELAAIRDQKPGVCHSVLTNVLRKNPEYTNLGVADRSGKILCSALPMEKTANLADRPYFQQIIKTHQFAVGSYQIGRVSGKVSIGVGYPLENTNGSMEAVIFAGMNLDWLQNLLAKIVEDMFDTQATITVIDTKGTVLARWPEGETWVGLDKPEWILLKPS